MKKIKLSILSATTFLSLFAISDVVELENCDQPSSKELIEIKTKWEIISLPKKNKKGKPKKTATAPNVSTIVGEEAIIKNVRRTCPDGRKDGVEIEQGVRIKITPSLTTKGEILIQGECEIEKPAVSSGGSHIDLKSDYLKASSVSSRTYVADMTKLYFSATINKNTNKHTFTVWAKDECYEITFEVNKVDMNMIRSRKQ